jgi:hypothetical protein
MTRNVGNADRIARLIAATALGVGALAAPFAPALRLAAFGLPAIYMVGTALVGTCLGYRLIGMSTCPAQRS